MKEVADRDRAPAEGRHSRQRRRVSHRARQVRLPEARFLGTPTSARYPRVRRAFPRAALASSSQTELRRTTEIDLRRQKLGKSLPSPMGTKATEKPRFRGFSK